MTCFAKYLFNNGQATGTVQALLSLSLNVLIYGKNKDCRHLRMELVSSVGIRESMYKRQLQVNLHAHVMKLFLLKNS